MSETTKSPTIQELIDEDISNEELGITLNQRSLILIESKGVGAAEILYYLANYHEFDWNCEPKDFDSLEDSQKEPFVKFFLNHVSEKMDLLHMYSISPDTRIFDKSLIGVENPYKFIWDHFYEKGLILRDIFGDKKCYRCTLTPYVLEKLTSLSDVSSSDLCKLIRSANHRDENSILEIWNMILKKGGKGVDENLWSWLMGGDGYDMSSQFLTSHLTEELSHNMQDILIKVISEKKIDLNLSFLCEILNGNAPTVGMRTLKPVEEEVSRQKNNNFSPYANLYEWLICSGD